MAVDAAGGRVHRREKGCSADGSPENGKRPAGLFFANLEEKESTRRAGAIRRDRQCLLRDYLFVRRLRECEVANKKAPPAVSSHLAKGAGGAAFWFYFLRKSETFKALQRL